MKRNAKISLISAFVLPLVLAGAKVAGAQDNAPTDQEQLGARLFNQSCGVCHLKQQIATTTYAPPLSKDTLNGKADVIRDVITNGTPRMPSFKTQFTAARIDAIVAYIQTIPAPAAAPPAKTHGAGEPD
jgi:mono/diheme cytochrome c family protein